MTTDTMPEITIEPSWDHRTGLCEIALRNGTELIHADRLDPVKVIERSRFVADVRSKFPGIDCETVERELLKLADFRSRCRKTKPQSKADAANPASEPWPELIDNAAYHGTVGELVRAIAPHTEADPIAVMASFLVAFGNIVGRNAHFVADGAKHCANLFAVLVGQSAKGRKGTSWNQPERVLRAAEELWVNERVQGGLSSGEGLIWAVRDPIVVKKSRGRGSSDVGEFTEDGGILDKRLMILESEFAGVLRVLDREGNKLSAIIRQAWDTGNLRTLTKNSPARATGAHVSIVGHITKDELRRYLSDTEAANGFGNRFIWLCVRRSKLLPDGGRLSDAAIAPLVKNVGEAINFASTVGEVQRDSAARDVWHSVYPKLAGERNGLFGFLTSRAEAQVMRIALIYSLLDCSSLIRPEHLLAALAVWEYAEASVRFLFGASLGDAIADTILRALRQSPAGLTRTQISELFQRNVRAERIASALKVLVDNDLACSVCESTGGRTADRWIATETSRT